MNVLEKNDHLLKAKLVFKSVEEFTDEEAKQVFLETELCSESDIIELVTYLENFRPNVAQEIKKHTKFFTVKL